MAASLMISGLCLVLLSWSVHCYAGDHGVHWSYLRSLNSDHGAFKVGYGPGPVTNQSVDARFPLSHQLSLRRKSSSSSRNASRVPVSAFLRPTYPAGGAQQKGRVPAAGLARTTAHASPATGLAAGSSPGNVAPSVRKLAIKGIPINLKKPASSKPTSSQPASSQPSQPASSQPSEPASSQPSELAPSHRSQPVLAPAHLSKPAPAHRSKPAPAHRSKPAPAHRSKPAPAHRSKPAPAHRSKPAPAHRSKPAPAHRSKPPPHISKPAPAHRSKPVPAHRSKPAPAHRSKPPPHISKPALGHRSKSPLHIFKPVPSHGSQVSPARSKPSDSLHRASVAYPGLSGYAASVGSGTRGSTVSGKDKAERPEPKDANPGVRKPDKGSQSYSAKKSSGIARQEEPMKGPRVRMWSQKFDPIPPTDSSEFVPGELSHLQAEYEHGDEVFESDVSHQESPQPHSSEEASTESMPLKPHWSSHEAQYDHFLRGKLPPGTLTHFSSNYAHGTDHWRDSLHLRIPSRYVPVSGEELAPQQPMWKDRKIWVQDPPVSSGTEGKKPQRFHVSRGFHPK